jgi:hypothetical protein
MKITIKTILLIALGISFALASSIGCSRETFTPPTATSLEEAPIELTAKQLYDEFNADPEGTKAKYANKKLHFPRVKVEKMSFLGEPVDPELYVMENNVKFRVTMPDYLRTVREGYTVEVVGTLWDKQYEFVIVEKCWIRVIDPPGGDPNPPPEY